MLTIVDCCVTIHAACYHHAPIPLRQAERGDAGAEERHAGGERTAKVDRSSS